MTLDQLIENLQQAKGEHGGNIDVVTIAEAEPRKKMQDDDSHELADIYMVARINGEGPVILCDMNFADMIADDSEADDGLE